MKDVIISITGTQDAPQGEDNTIELVTEGKYCFKDGRGKLTYMESELTGMAGTKTSFTFSPDEVVLSREGTLTSCMIFRQGTKNTFLYDTPYGSLSVGVSTRKMHAELGLSGGSIEIDYAIEIDHAVAGQNLFQINVREKRPILQQ